MSQSEAASGQRLEALSVAMGELEALWRAKQSTSEQFTEACAAVALKAGLDASVVKTYVNVRCRDKLETGKRKVEQLSLVFDMLA